MTSADNGRPVADVVPTLRFRDAARVIAFLDEAFGLTPTMVVPGPEDTVAHAQLRWGNGCVMAASDAGDAPGRLKTAVGGVCVYLILDTDDDVDKHYARAVAAGAEIERELQDEDYGGRGYVARDPEGNLWAFGSYRPE
ncbi:VOC family protein [Uniformispora flossi]|uniref:VOC family protein n=1 Tax=Uniformispora flossi TaxID=3390723 RepID=UPI003C2AD7D1